MNVRILATTNRDLLAEVQRGAFREDLYFRLNVVSLRIPPLRERPGDIAALAEHFARRYADVNGLPFRPLSREAMLRLTSHAWRGNVRELENVIHRAVLLADGAAIGIEAIELGPSGRERAAAGCRRHRLAGRPPDGGGGARSDHRDAGHTLGNRTHAATILGISIRALRNKLRDYAAHGVAVPPPAAGVAA